MNDSDDIMQASKSFEDALRAIGPRPQPSSEASMRAYARAHDAWEKMTRQRARGRHGRIFAGLLAASTAIATIGIALRPSAPALQTVATVAFAHGASNHLAASGAVSSLRKRDTVQSGSILETSDSARLALQLLTGHSLRLDRDTRIAIVGATDFRLERGRVYVDSGVTQAAQSLRIDTPVASVVDVGTQFQVTWIANALRVQVREGSVIVSRMNDGATANVAAGEVVSLSSSQGIHRGAGAAFGDEWAWAAQTSPGIVPQERRLDRVLAWVCRELGYELRFTNARTEALVAQVVLDGSLEGLTPQQTLEVLQSITTFRYRQEAGELTLESIDGHL